MSDAMQTHAADRLLGAIERCGSPVCVGIDPVIEQLPQRHSRADGNPEAQPAQAIRSFTLGVLDAVADSGCIPCVKFQSACYERYGYEGVRVLEEMIGEAKLRSLEVILDAKRGDIGITAQHYAAAAFTTSADWLTINSYLGVDGIEPFLIDGRGAFALVRTSNPGGDALQSLKLASGETVAEAVAKTIAQLGEQSIGKGGFSSLGAVVGATKPEDAAKLRAIMPKQIFLVPGYGAQGGSAKDVLPCFRKDDSGRRTGAVITASRSVIYAFEPDDAKWIDAVQDAAKRFANAIAAITNS